MSQWVSFICVLLHTCIESFLDALEQPVFGHKLQHRANRGLEAEQVFDLSCAQTFTMIGTEGNDPLPQSTALRASGCLRAARYIRGRPHRHERLYQVHERIQHRLGHLRKIEITLHAWLLPAPTEGSAAP